MNHAMRESMSLTGISLGDAQTEYWALEAQQVVLAEQITANRKGINEHRLAMAEAKRSGSLEVLTTGASEYVERQLSTQMGIARSRMNALTVYIESFARRETVERVNAAIEAYAAAAVACNKAYIEMSALIRYDNDSGVRLKSFNLPVGSSKAFEPLKANNASFFRDLQQEERAVDIRESDRLEELTRRPE